MLQIPYPARPSTREITPTYWRKLIEAGVPIDRANDIAWAIARYDTTKKPPTPTQKALIQQYCPLVCRAELWRSQLLLEQQTN